MRGLANSVTVVTEAVHARACEFCDRRHGGSPCEGLRIPVPLIRSVVAFCRVLRPV
jgi:hypothetical protein